MRGSWGGSDAGTFELGPLERDQVQCVGIPRDDVFPGISSGTSKEDNL